MMKTGIELIAQERQEQLSKHGWNAEYDDQHTRSELLEAAEECINMVLPNESKTPMRWPFSAFGYLKIKGKSDIGKLKVAGALIAAEIDRLQRKNQ